MTDQDTFSVRLAERDIEFRYPLPGQLIILQRRLMRLRDQADQEESEQGRVRLGSQLIVDTLDLVESLILQPGDAKFLENAMLVGKVGHEEVMAILRVKRPDPKPARKRAAAKATASRGRAKR